MSRRFTYACTATLIAATAAACGGDALTEAVDAGNPGHPRSDASVPIGDDASLPESDATLGDDTSVDATLDSGPLDAAVTDATSEVEASRDAASDAGASDASTSVCGAQTTCAHDGGAPSCAKTDTDNANCGACGHACESGTVCTGGECKITCGALATCAPDGGATYCASTDTDNANCGTCGHTCAAGTVCSGGSCMTTCGANFITCGGSCVDGKNDPNHCGATGDCSGANAGVACATGKSCVSGSCVCDGKATCKGACVDTAADTNNCGGCGNVCGGICANGGCVTSCASLLALEPTAPSGTYLIDPDGIGPNPAYSAYCDMTHAGGGWTLALKADGSLATTNFDYGSPYWTDATTFNDATADLSMTEAKYRSFAQIVASSVLLVVADTSAGKPSPPTNYQALSLSSPATLLSLVSGPFTSTAIGRSAWLALADNATIQPFCGAEGFDLYFGSPYSRARIGMVGNQENNCGSPDSALGFGVDVGPNSPCWTKGASPSYAVGVLGGANCTPAGVDRTLFGYVFVR